MAVAANFYQVLKELVEEHDISADLVLGSSRSLYEQVKDDSNEFDVFLSAGSGWPQMLEQIGKGEYRRPYTRGRLAFWHRSGMELLPANVRDFLSQNNASIFIADPERAPYGRAAEQALANLMVDNEIKVSEHVHAAWNATRESDVDTALVAASLVAGEPADHVTILPESFYAPVDLVQELVILSRTDKSLQAREFVDFLLQPDTQNFLAERGYSRVFSVYLNQTTQSGGAVANALNSVSLAVLVVVLGVLSCVF